MLIGFDLSLFPLGWEEGIFPVVDVFQRGEDQGDNNITIQPSIQTAIPGKSAQKIIPSKNDRVSRGN